MSLHRMGASGYYFFMNTFGRKSYVYILSNKRRTVVYVGSTDELKKRIYFHKKRLIPGFTKKYNADQLVYFEAHRSTDKALGREKQIKGLVRKKKNRLIEKMNPDWTDLYEKLGR